MYFPKNPISPSKMASFWGSIKHTPAFHTASNPCSSGSKDSLGLHNDSTYVSCIKLYSMCCLLFGVGSFHNSSHFFGNKKQKIFPSLKTKMWVIFLNRRQQKKSIFQESRSFIVPTMTFHCFQVFLNCPIFCIIWYKKTCCLESQEKSRSLLKHIQKKPRCRCPVRRARRRTS